jgi:hypothetical protein
MPFITSRMSTVRGWPPGLASGIRGASSSHWASVKACPERSRRVAGVWFAHHVPKVPYDNLLLTHPVRAGTPGSCYQQGRVVGTLATLT